MTLTRRHDEQPWLILLQFPTQTNQKTDVKEKRMAAVPASLGDIAKRKGNQLRGRMETANSSKQKQRRVISLGGGGAGGEETSTGVISLFRTNARIDKEVSGVNLM